MDTENEVVNQEEQDEVIIPAGAVTTANQAPSEEQPAETTSEEVTTPTEEEPDDSEQILKMGKELYEYQKSHPGFDPYLLHKDYTRKAMENAELKKKLKPEEAKEIDPDLKDFTDQDLKRFAKVAKTLGFVQKDEIVEKTFTDAKQEALELFLDKHPEYRPENDPKDEMWKAVLGEYQLYKEPQNKKAIVQLLERSHAIVSKTFRKPKAASTVQAQARTNQVASASGGASRGASAEKPKGTVPDKARYFLKGFSDDELNEMYS